MSAPPTASAEHREHDLYSHARRRVGNPTQLHRTVAIIIDSTVEFVAESKFKDGMRVRLVGDALAETDHPEMVIGEVMVVDPFGEIHVGFPNANEREQAGIYQPENLEIVED